MRLAAVVLLSVLPAMAAAQAVDCDNALTQADMNACAYQDWEQADAELNALWPKARAAMKRLDSVLSDDLRGADAALLASQRAWIAFRDAQCRAEGFAMRGGSAEPMLVSGCLATLTRQRIEDLRLMTEVN
jgi:uncharacterized protein YecT (DUF1311 family)